MYVYIYIYVRSNSPPQDARYNYYHYCFGTGRYRERCFYFSRRSDKTFNCLGFIFFPSWAFRTRRWQNDSAVNDSHLLMLLQCSIFIVSRRIITQPRPTHDHTIAYGEKNGFYSQNRPLRVVLFVFSFFFFRDTSFKFKTSFVRPLFATNKYKRLYTEYMEYVSRWTQNTLSCRTISLNHYGNPISF